MHFIDPHIHIASRTTDEEQLNVHLGPANAVADTVAKLSVGQEITVKAFRTEKMKAHHYTAQSLTFGQTTAELRDSNLRPVWAQGTGAQRGTMAGGARSGKGLGRGWGRGGRSWHGGR